MSCSNCYNGCSEIVSDQCVRYTGIDVSVLGIKNGDSLSFIEQALITFLTSTLDGTGIKPNIPEEIICELISQYLPTCGDITIVDICTALIKGACDLQTQVTDNTDDIVAIKVILDALNADYDVSCLSGVINSSDTHAVVQAIITKLCGFITQVDTTYVKNSELCTLVQSCIGSSSSLYSDKMVPFIAYEYYGSVSGFDISGAGTGDWLNVYLCNGNNGTPDKRGRVAIGVTTGMGGPTLNPIVAPGGLNPNYTIGSNAGANGVALTTAQLAAHTHANTVNSSIDDPGHYTDIKVALSSHTEWDDNSSNLGQPINNIENVSGPNGNATQQVATTTTKAYTDITVQTSITNQSAGLGEQHSNVQPGIGAYYIMYIP